MRTLLLALSLLLASCAGRGTPTLRAGAPVASKATGFLAGCVVAPDLPAAVHEKLIVIAHIAGPTLSSVESDSDLPEDAAWEAVSGGNAQIGPGEAIRDGNVAVASVGRCTENGALWSTLPFRRVPRPDGAEADALDQRIADRRAESEKEATGNVETSFSESRVEWLELEDAPGLVFRVTTLETGFSECEAPSEPGGDSVCGSLAETRIVVESAREGAAVETAETLISSVGC